ncbi:MAG: TSUP family transporter [Pseudomonadota bacterium]
MMESVQFMDLNAATVFLLVLIGFVAGMVSGFIGSGGAFVLTPAMMSLGAPAMVAVASNICHKFPKAMVGAVKRNRYGQVDVKLGVIMGVFAEIGIMAGKHVMLEVKEVFGHTGTDLYVSVIFIVVLLVVGSYMWRDYRRLKALGHDEEEKLTPIAAWVQSVNIPGTMVYFQSLKKRISVLFIIPLAFATGMLAATIAVGGFIGVPAMIYVLGMPAIMATATELVVAFIMGLGGTFMYALDGMVDVRLSMLILLGSLFGIQLGAIGTTYVKDYQVKLVMATIMLTVLFSRFFYVPGYLSDLGMIAPIAPENVSTLKTLGDSVLAVALILGAVTVLTALTKGIAEHRKVELERERAAAEAQAEAAAAVAAVNLDPMARFERILLATDGSEFSTGAERVAVSLARRHGARLSILGVAVYNPMYGSSAPELEREATEQARRNVERAARQAEGIDSEVVVRQAADPYKGIVEAAEACRADVIVMGRRGRRGLAMMMVGDATMRVLGHAPCNVMVVPKDAQVCSHGILVATDGSRYGDAAALTAGKLAKASGLPLAVLSAVMESHSQKRRQEAGLAVQRVKDGLHAEGIEIETLVQDGVRAEDVILEQARQRGADLIVVGTHGRTGLQRVLVGSIAERVIGGASSAVLAVKAA